MFLTNPLSESIVLPDAAIIALLGYGVVFFGLISLMAVVILMSRAFTGRKVAQSVPAAPTVPTVPAAPSVPAANAPAPGSAGTLKLHDVPPKTAAMLMAIVADQLGKPLNELRFISIREVK